PHQRPSHCAQLAVRTRVTMMTLKRKFILRHLFLLLGLCVLGATATWGLLQLRDQLHRTVYLYEQLASIEPAEVQLARVHGALDAGATDRTKLPASLDDVLAR